MTKQKYEISIILIVYKTLGWIQDCVKSIYGQTWNDFELIIVNNDDDPLMEKAIFTAIEGKENTYYIHNTENLGGAEACNQGIRAAHGRYVFFMDSDDVLPPTAFESLINKADSGNFDVVIGRGKILRKGKLYNVDYDPDRITWERDFETDNLESAPWLTFNPYYWGRLYRKEMLEQNNVLMEKGALNADRNFNCKALLVAKKIAVTSEITYYWRKHDDDDYKSVTRSRSKYNNFLDRVKMMERTDELFKSADKKSLYNYSRLSGLMRLLILAVDTVDNPGFRELYLDTMSQYLQAFTYEQISSCEMMTYRPKTLAYLIKSGKYDQFDVIAGKNEKKKVVYSGDRSIYEYSNLSVPTEFRTQYRFRIPEIDGILSKNGRALLIKAKGCLWESCDPTLVAVVIMDRDGQEKFRKTPLSEITSDNFLSIECEFCKTDLSSLEPDEIYYFSVVYIIHSRVRETKIKDIEGKDLTYTPKTSDLTKAMRFLSRLVNYNAH